MNNSLAFTSISDFYALTLKGCAFRFALVCPTVRLKIFDFISKVEKWWHPCPMDTFLDYQ